jgi:hypothetical protein
MHRTTMSQSTMSQGAVHVYGRATSTNTVAIRTMSPTTRKATLVSAHKNGSRFRGSSLTISWRDLHQLYQASPTQPYRPLFAGVVSGEVQLNLPMLL